MSRSVMSSDAILAKIQSDCQKKIERDNYQKAQHAYKFACKLYHSVITSKHYDERYNYTTCIWSILCAFPKIVTTKSAPILLSSIRRLHGLMKKKTINPAKMHTIEKISKELFCELMPHTGANFILTGLKDKNLQDGEMYDLLNDTTPVVFAIQISPSTIIYNLVDDTKAKELAAKYNNCTLKMLDGEADDMNSFVSSKIHTIYVKTQLNLRSNSFEWGTKSSSVECVIETMNFRAPLHKIIDHSANMKSRFDA